MPSHASIVHVPFGAHREQLRSMLVAVLGDEHAADDVLQDAWIRGRGRHPLDPRACRAWAATLVRRLALNEKRAASRRRDREAQAARAEALPSTAEIAERFETQQQILSVFEGLPDPQRSLLRDRYFGGLLPSEIALRDGLSVHTVKDRLRRARAILRRELESAGLGPHGARMSAFGPLAFLVSHVRSAPPIAALTKALGGLITMKATVLLALVLLAAVALWRQGASPIDNAAPQDGARLEGQRSERIGTIDGKVTGKGELTAPDTSGAARDVQPVPNTAAVEPMWLIEGRVQELRHGDAATDLPLPIFDIELLVYAGYAAEGDPIERGRVSTQPDGSFECSIGARVETVTLAVKPVPVPGVSIRSVSPRLAIAGNGPPGPIIIRFKRYDSRIEGVVRSESSGAAVAGATVRFNDITTLTDASGGYRLQVPSEGYGSLIVSADGYRRGGISPGGRVPGGLLSIDIALEDELGPAGEVFGYVRDDEGAFVVGATVRSSSAPAREFVTTDATGRYALKGVQLYEDVYVEVTARADEFAEAKQDLRLTAGEPPRENGTQLDFVLVRGTRIEGVVTDAGGGVIRGARLWLGDMPKLSANRTTYSDDEGRYSFDHVRPGKILLGAHRAGFSEVVETLLVGPSSDEALLHTVVLSRGATVTGVVRDLSGEPVVGATVTGRALVQVQGAATGHSQTAEGGRFQLQGLPTGDLLIEVKGTGLAGAREEVQAGTPDVELVVPRAARLFGRVIDAQTRKPITSFKVRVPFPEEGDERPWFMTMEASWVWGGREFGDPDGRWSTGELDPIRPGSWTAVEIEAVGYEVLRIEPFEVPARGAETEIECRLVRN